MSVFGDTAYSTTSKNLINRLKTKEITLKEFLQECAYWALKDGFDDLRPMSFPTPPNSPAFNEYDALLPERRAKIDLDFFKKNYEINAYYAQVLFVRNHNKANMDWLNHVKFYLSEEDLIMRQRVDNRLLEFNAFIDDNPLMVEKIKATFKAKETAPKKKNYYSVGEVI